MVFTLDLISASWETVLVSFAQVIGGVQRSRSMSVMYLFPHRRRRQKAGAFSCFFFLLFLSLGCVSLAQQAVPRRRRR